MKKHSIVLAILALTLVLGLAFVSCDNDATGGSTKFEGRWYDAGTLGMGFIDYSFTFSGNNFVFRKADLGGHPSNNRVCTGTFTFTDNYFTWIPAEGEDWTSYSQTYRWLNNGRTLSLGNPPGGNYNPFCGANTFEKQ